MSLTAASAPPVSPLVSETSRLDFLDATRAFVLVLGVLFHASLSFLPVFLGWAVQDVSTSSWLVPFSTLSHCFRLEAFFLIAGVLSRSALLRKGTAEFLRTRFVRIVVPFVAGWFVLRPLLVSGWILGAASLRGPVDIEAGLRDGFLSLGALPAGIFTGSHLWFLYYLALVTGLVLVGRGLLMRTGAWTDERARRVDAGAAWLARSPLSTLVLAVPVGAALWGMRSWGMDTPDQSLRPHGPALVVYGGFFVLGWLWGRRLETLDALSQALRPRAILAGLGGVAVLWLGDIERDPGHPHHLAAHVAYALSYGLTMGSLVFLGLGLFRRFCPGRTVFARYLADASYWTYLVHLPVVVGLQVAVAAVPIHWSLKLGFVVTATLVFCLLSYDLVVRSSFVGWVLNGRRRDRVVFPHLWLRMRSFTRGRRRSPGMCLLPGNE